MKTMMMTCQKRGRGANKTAIIGIKEKKGGVKAKIVDNVKFTTLMNFAKDNVEKGVEFHTDEFTSYSKFGNHFNHRQVNHLIEYVTADKITTNGIEGFWSLLKRGIQGNFHHLSRGYLQHIDEFVWHYNARSLTQEAIFDKMLLN